MTKFSSISKIDLNNKESWKNITFLTFDVDWAQDEVILETIELLENYKVPSTWYITHDSEIINRLRKNNIFELGIHPNFNNLLNGNTDTLKNAEQVFEYLLEIVPEALSFRSHSLTQSSRIIDLSKKYGLTHDCNHFIPYHSNISSMPWLHWNGMIKVPFFWEDDVACIEGLSFSLKSLLSQDTLRVFNFHPIHIFLNSESLERYERARPWLKNPSKLIKYKNFTNLGVKDLLIEIIES